MKGISILFENDFCLVINKAAGLAVQGGEGVKDSLDSLLSENFSPRPLLVHRLDKDTSGLILVAKNRGAAAIFSSLFAGSKITKIYRGICSGLPKAESGIINLDLETKGKKRSLKKSETHYRLISSSSGEDCFSLLELELGTGRMHQIRRHLAQIGHPLLGDDKYGDFPLNKKLKKNMGLKNLLLHAYRLVIPPLKELPQGLDISAPLPEYFTLPGL